MTRRERTGRIGRHARRRSGSSSSTRTTRWCSPAGARSARSRSPTRPTARCRRRATTRSSSATRSPATRTPPAPRRPGAAGWWDNLIGPGKPLDTDRFFVVCPNLLGGCQGTHRAARRRTRPPGRPTAWTSRCCRWPTSSPCTGGCWRTSASSGCTPRSAARSAGCRCSSGRSTRPGEVANAVVVAASSRLTAQNIAFSAVAREAIMRDPDFAGGRYVGTGRAAAPRAGDRPDDGAHHLPLRGGDAREVRPPAAGPGDGARPGWGSASTSRSRATSTTRAQSSSTASTRCPTST